MYDKFSSSLPAVRNGRVLDQGLGLCVLDGEVGVDADGDDLVEGPSVVESLLQAEDGPDVVEVGKTVDQVNP